MKGSHTFTPNTPAHVSATYRSENVVSMPLRPVRQPGLATTPKLTGGHGVARGPDRVDGFALRPAWTSQLVFWWDIARGCCRGRGPAGC
jgi:hypothetical protein